MVDPLIHRMAASSCLGANEWRPMSPDMKKGGPANGAMNGAMRLGKSVEPILGKKQRSNGKSRKNWEWPGQHTKSY